MIQGKAQKMMGRQYTRNTRHPSTEYKKLDSLCPRSIKMEKRRWEGQKNLSASWRSIWLYVLYTGFCQKLSAKVWEWMGGNRDHLINFSTAERVVTFILLGWITFYYQQLMQIFCIKCDVKHDAWCLQLQNTGVGIAGLVHRF